MGRVKSIQLCRFIPQTCLIPETARSRKIVECFRIILLVVTAQGSVKKQVGILRPIILKVARFIASLLDFDDDRCVFNSPHEWCVRRKLDHSTEERLVESVLDIPYFRKVAPIWAAISG